ncbi:MAG: hypothetical protein JWP92_1630 [Caulobacter sp.]|nr:hypothetical protein [Caulobacter sp.]
MLSPRGMETFATQPVLAELDMAPSRARSTPWKRGGALVMALAIHVVLLGLMALPALDTLRGALDEPPAVDLTLEPFLVPTEREPQVRAARSAGAAYAPRPAAPSALPSPVAPIPAVGAAPARPGPTVGTGDHPAPLPVGPVGDLRAALRASGVGCANADAVGLTRRERDRCHEAWGQASRDAPVYANAPASARAGQEFARQALRQDIDRAYRSEPMATGPDPKMGPPRGIPPVLGAQQDALGRPMDAAHQELKHLEDAMRR